MKSAKDFLIEKSVIFPSAKFDKKIDLNLGSIIVLMEDYAKERIREEEEADREWDLKMQKTAVEEHDLSALEPVVKTMPVSIALKLCDIQIHNDVLKRVVDIVNIIIEKGDNTSLKDIAELKAKWSMMNVINQK
jgi:hypothetical protein